MSHFCVQSCKVNSTCPLALTDELKKKWRWWGLYLENYCLGLHGRQSFAVGTLSPCCVKGPGLG